jgi:hypothetical protein
MNEERHDFVFAVFEAVEALRFMHVEEKQPEKI